MQFAAALSIEPDTSAAVAEVCRRAASQLAAAPDLAVLFVSHDHGPDFDAVVSAAHELTGAAHLLGCTGEAIIGGSQEIEAGPAISLWLARLPGVTLVPMRLEFTRTPEGGSFVGWPDTMLEAWPAGAALLLLGEPFSFPADWLLERLGEDRAGIRVLGGMASGAAAPGGNRIFLDGQSFDSGAAALLVHGDVEVRSVVSQGCRPIGRPLVVTKAQRNVILELGGRPPLALVQEFFEASSPAEQRLIERGLHVGVVINEYQERFGRGDFLVRNVVGADRDSGAIAIGDFVRPGQTVQFHVRDATSADEDLRELLSAACVSGGAAPQGALLFTCNGRGTRLFPDPHHDAGVVGEMLKGIPAAGFFAQGEIGPVGGRNFLHGFTASVALFAPRS